MVSLFIKAETVKELGLPIKDFFVWSDDWEFTSRISKKYNSYYVKDSVVIHKSNSNVGASIVDTSDDRIDRFNSDLIIVAKSRWFSLYQLNPMNIIVTAYRDILYAGKVPELTKLAIMLGISIVLLWIGFRVFDRLKRRFSEVM